MNDKEVKEYEKDLGGGISQTPHNYSDDEDNDKLAYIVVSVLIIVAGIAIACLI